TCTGTPLSIPVPSPSCPSELLPQHQRVASSRTAQVCAPPAESCLARLPSAVTGIGTGETPNPPQHQTVPSCLRAQVWRPPPETSAMTLVQPQAFGVPAPPQLSGGVQVSRQLPPQPSSPPHLPAQIWVQQTAVPGSPGFILQRLPAPHEESVIQVGHIEGSSSAQICRAPCGPHRLAPTVQALWQGEASASGAAST